MRLTYEAIMRTLDPAYLPTKEQKEVILATEPTLLVVAGAGSGKTATMTKRIAYHLAMGNVRADEILGLTFTRKAAGELAERVESALALLRSRALLAGTGKGITPARLHESLARPMISTYNSFASGIAASYGMLIGADSNARLITDGERVQVMASVVDSLSASDPDAAILSEKSRKSLISASLTLAAGLIDNRVHPEEAQHFFDQQITALAELATRSKVAKKTSEEGKAWATLMGAGISSLELRRSLLRLVEGYQVRKAELGVIEYADQVALASRVCTEYPEIGRDIASRYRLILLDEYQDTSINQARLLLDALAPSDPLPGMRSVCAVGDPQQAIYGWRGASASALADFAQAFGERMGKTRLLNLSISFRNDAAILSAANSLVSAGETKNEEDLKVRGKDRFSYVAPVALRPRPHAGVGRVLEVRTWLREDSYRAIAWRIRDVMRAAEAEGREAEIAVLCRKRRYFDPMIRALNDLGIPYEVVGGESLVQRPEILTIRALLGLLTNPQRNDLLLRLLTHFGANYTEITELKNAASSYAKRERAELAVESVGEEEDRLIVNLVEGLPRFTSNTEEAVVDILAGRSARLVAEILHKMSGVLHSPLPLVVARASQLLGLELSAASRGKGARRVQTSLDSFISLAATYAHSHPTASLKDFNEWLDAVADHEHDGEEEAGSDLFEDVDIHAGVVQIMTVHAAKGLEWRDLVAVPEMVAGQFSAITSGVKAWPQNASLFPYPLRADYVHLPHFTCAHHSDATQAGAEYSRFKTEDLPNYETREARRLAYVAWTRPRSELLLAGYAFVRPTLKHDKKKSSHVEILPRSSFLSEIRTTSSRDASMCNVEEIATVAGEDWPSELLVQAPEEASPEEIEAALGYLENPTILPPIPHYEKSTQPHWPGDVPRLEKGMESSFALSLDELEWNLNTLLVEAEAGSDDLIERPYYTATDMVHLSEDPEVFARNQMRPIPSPPSRAARLGTSIHARIAQSFSHASTLDIDKPEEMEEIDTLAPANFEEEEALMRAFEASPWAKFPAIAIESPLEIVVGGRILRCTIDAVLDTSADPTRAPLTIVDWKSGCHPSPAQLPSRELQLAIYRLAWARAAGVQLDQIDAAFVYLRENEERRDLYAGKLSEEEIVTRIAENFGKGEEALRSHRPYTSRDPGEA